MKNMNDVAIKYYCNSCGDVFDPDIQDPRGPEFGARLLDYPSDLPKELYRLYIDYWNNALSVSCYITVMDCMPGVLLSAEYGGQDYSHMLCRAQGLEIAARSVSAECTILTGQYPECKKCNVLMLFIPNTVEHGAVYKLMYLMDKYAYDGNICLDGLFDEKANGEYASFLSRVGYTRIGKPALDRLRSLLLVEERNVDGCGTNTVMPVYVYRPVEPRDVALLTDRLIAVRAVGEHNEDTDDAIVECACNDIFGSRGVHWDFAQVTNYIEF